VNDRNADGISFDLAAQLDSEDAERRARKRRRAEQAKAEGNYSELFGSYAAGIGFVAPDVDADTKAERRAARNALRARNKARGLPLDTPEPPDHLDHRNRS
jgi:hypothetical protein